MSNGRKRKSKKLLSLFKAVALVTIPLVTAILTVVLNPIDTFPFLKWQKLRSLPEGVASDIVTAGIDPLGHIDQLFVLNDRDKLYQWEHRLGQKVTEVEWKFILDNSDRLIDEIKSVSVPVSSELAVYGKNDADTIFIYKGETNSWEIADQNELPVFINSDPPSSLSSFPRLPIDELQVAEQKRFGFQGSLSEGDRYYIRSTGGDLYLYSKTTTVGTLFYLFISGLVLGIIIDVLIFLFWRNKAQQK